MFILLPGGLRETCVAHDPARNVLKSARRDGDIGENVLVFDTLIIDMYKAMYTLEVIAELNDACKLRVNWLSLKVIT